MFAGNGQSLVAYPFRVVWMYQSVEYIDRMAALNELYVRPAQVQVAFSVSKRNFKTAVDRNRIKRLMREAWRFNKQHLLEKIGADTPPLAIMLMYLPKTLLTLPDMEHGVRKMIHKIDITPQLPQS